MISFLAPTASRLLDIWKSPWLVPSRLHTAALLLAFMVLALTYSAAADSPRERLRLDSGWRFHLGDAPDAAKQFDYPEVSDLAKSRKGEIGRPGNLVEILPDPPLESLGTQVSFVQPAFDDSGWRQLDVPHDWAVELPFAANGAAMTGHNENDGTEINVTGAKGLVSHGFKTVGPMFPQNSIAWYRRNFDLPKDDKGKSLCLEFDGVYRNSLVWLNGHCLGRHLDGYASFRYDISQCANYGGKNELVVRVDASRYEGWFYEGAGIYRHVWLEKSSPLHIAPDGTFVWTTGGTSSASPTTIHIQTELTNASSASAPLRISYQVLGPDAQPVKGGDAQTDVTLQPGFAKQTSAAIQVKGANLWSPESPKLYKLVTTVTSRGKTVDRTETEFGIRSIAFDSQKGFLLNGKPYTIKGTCNHQDHAGVGSAIPDALEYYRVKKLKEMGCNALRTSHNPPAPELLEACDRLGMLVMDENRRMDTNSETLADLTGTILRDRNHPGVFIWSLGNEEPYLQGTNAGASVAAVMQQLVHKLDPTRLCTVAMNGKWGLGFSTVIDVQGFNYGTKNISSYHANHLTQPEIGTETASTVTTRGIYQDDPQAGYLSAYGEAHPGWGAKPWEWWPYYATNPFASGGFVWTGFDYRGEPTPYKWPCINSHFGIMDTCGFPKDIYYYYQSWWTDQPVLHLAPHWNWPGREGKPVLVRVFSNCKQVELFLNGASLGKQAMKPESYLDWTVPYQPGALTAKGFDENGKLITEAKVETTGAPAAIRLTPDRTTLHADGEDVDIVNVSVVDAEGRPVPVADNLVHFELAGPGKIIGVGNGDPSSHEPDKSDQRKLFAGRAQVLIQAGTDPRALHLSAHADGLTPAIATVAVDAPKDKPLNSYIAGANP